MLETFMDSVDEKLDTILESPIFGGQRVKRTQSRRAQSQSRTSTRSQNRTSTYSLTMRTSVSPERRVSGHCLF